MESVPISSPRDLNRKGGEPPDIPNFDTVTTLSEATHTRSHIVGTASTPAALGRRSANPVARRQNYGRDGRIRSRMSGGGGCKVEVVTEAYDLRPAGERYETIDDFLLSRWTGTDGHEPVGYRTLADEFNRRLLKRVYDDHGREVLAARLETDYATLTGDDELRRAELEDHLADDGLDAERIRRDMVSWGTMATHLKDCLGGQKDPPTATTDWERRSIAIATDRAQQTVEEAVSALVSKGELDAPAGVEAGLQVRLGCRACEARVPLAIALDRGYVCETHR